MLLLSFEMFILNRPSSLSSAYSAGLSLLLGHPFRWATPSITHIWLCWVQLSRRRADGVLAITLCKQLPCSFGRSSSNHSFSFSIWALDIKPPKFSLEEVTTFEFLRSRKWLIHSGQGARGPGWKLWLEEEHLNAKATSQPQKSFDLILPCVWILSWKMPLVLLHEDLLRPWFVDCCTLYLHPTSDSQPSPGRGQSPRWPLPDHS